MDMLWEFRMIIVIPHSHAVPWTLRELPDCEYQYACHFIPLRYRPEQREQKFSRRETQQECGVERWVSKESKDVKLLGEWTAPFSVSPDLGLERGCGTMLCSLWPFSSGLHLCHLVSPSLFLHHHLFDSNFVKKSLTRAPFFPEIVGFPCLTMTQDHGQRPGPTLSLALHWSAPVPIVQSPMSSLTTLYRFPPTTSS